MADATQTDTPVEQKDPAEETQDGVLTPAAEPTDAVESPADPNAASQEASTPGDATAPASEEAPAEGVDPTMDAGTTPMPESGTAGDATQTDSLSDSSSPTSTSDAPLADEAGASAPADDAAGTAPEEAHDAPLDSSAASDASPAPEATDAPADATAPEASSDEQGGDEPKEVKGDGATHTGTDTPPVLKSNPIDPVTGRLLDGSQERTNKLPPFGGGTGSAASPSGHVIADGSQGSSDDAGDEDEGIDESTVEFDGGDETPDCLAEVARQLREMADKITFMSDLLSDYDEE